MNFKKMTSDLSTTFHRAVQYTGEKLGHTKHTEYEPEFKELLRVADLSQHWTEQLIKSTEAILQPNPALRVEDLMFEKLEHDKPDHLSPLEDLGEVLASSGNEMGPMTDYGKALLCISRTETELAQLEREFVHTSNEVFLKPLHTFLDNDFKALHKECKELEKVRLDLDSAKNHAKKDNEATDVGAEYEKEQLVFDHQLEVTRLLLEGIQTLHATHLNGLRDFAKAQMKYHEDCYHKMKELHQEWKST